MSFISIAGYFGLSETAIRRRYHRAKGNLQLVDRSYNCEVLVPDAVGLRRHNTGKIGGARANGTAPL